MDINQTNKNKTDNWMYFPETATLCQYLNRTDLIELSKCCRRYRNQLERKVLEKLDLNTWTRNNCDNYGDFFLSKKCNKILGFLKSDLGNKLKFAKKAALDCDIFPFISIYFIKLLPNIKSLKFSGNFEDENLLPSLAVILKGLKSLEHVDFGYFWVSLYGRYFQEQIFPLTLKSLKINYNANFDYNGGTLMIHDTIDSRYTNLYSLEIVSNRMLQNLSYEMPNLQEVVIKDIFNFDKSKVVDFLIANPQLKKINIDFQGCNTKILKTILSSKYLEHLCITLKILKEIEISSLPLNYSIKYLNINSELHADLMLKLVEVCNNLYSLNLCDVWGSADYNWRKLDRRINILKINSYDITQCAIKIDAPKLFNKVHIIVHGSIDEFIDKHNIDKLKNYKFTYSESKLCTLKIIN